MPLLRPLLAAALGAAALVALPAQAGSATDALTRCLADNTTGRERTDLARWIFQAMAIHPEMKNLSTVSAADREQGERRTAAIFTKLLGDSCPQETRQAMKAEGSPALQAAFTVLGQLAMQELMSNRDVAQSISGFERFLDKSKLEAAFGAN